MTDFKFAKPGEVWTITLKGEELWLVVKNRHGKMLLLCIHMEHPEAILKPGVVWKPGASNFAWTRVI
jgi:hypothetical protein